MITVIDGHLNASGNPTPDTSWPNDPTDVTRGVYVKPKRRLANPTGPDAYSLPTSVGCCVVKCPTSDMAESRGTAAIFLAFTLAVGCRVRRGSTLVALALTSH